MALFTNQIEIIANQRAGFMLKTNLSHDQDGMHQNLNQVFSRNDEESTVNQKLNHNFNLKFSAHYFWGID